MEEKYPNLPSELNVEDPITQALTNFLGFCARNVKSLLLAGLCVIVIFSGVTGFWAWQEKKENAAMTNLGILMLETARSGNDSNFLPSLEKMGEAAPATFAARLARLYTARIFAEKGETDSALINYNQALASLGKDDPFLKKMILWERAYAYLALGDTQSALSDFTSLSSEKSAFQESALYQISRLEAALGNKEAADAAHDKLLELYPDSFYILLEL